MSAPTEFIILIVRHDRKISKHKQQNSEEPSQSTNPFLAPCFSFVEIGFLSLLDLQSSKGKVQIVANEKGEMQR